MLAIEIFQSYVECISCHVMQTLHLSRNIYIQCLDFVKRYSIKNKWLMEKTITEKIGDGKEGEEKKKVLVKANSTDLKQVMRNKISSCSRKR